MGVMARIRTQSSVQTKSKAAARDSFHAMMSWAEKCGRAFRLEELPGLMSIRVQLRYDVKSL